MSDQGGKPKGRWLRRAKYGALLVLVALPVIVLFQNVDNRVATQILFWKPELPVILTLLAALAVGAAAGLWAGLRWHRTKQ